MFKTLPRRLKSVSNFLRNYCSTLVPIFIKSDFPFFWLTNLRLIVYVNIIIWLLTLWLKITETRKVDKKVHTQIVTHTAFYNCFVRIMISAFMFEFILSKNSGRSLVRHCVCIFRSYFVPNTTWWNCSLLLLQTEHSNLVIIL